jgi:hypothetical protein
MRSLRPTTGRRPSALAGDKDGCTVCALCADRLEANAQQKACPSLIYQLCKSFGGLDSCVMLNVFAVFCMPGVSRGLNAQLGEASRLCSPTPKESIIPRDS